MNLNNNFPRFLTRDSKPFNPIALAKKNEKIVCNDNSRRYTDFYCTGVYGGISTGYLTGCCLRCIFCWVSLSREYPEKYGKFYSAEEAASLLIHNARKSGVNKVRISGGEPTIGKEHLLKVLDFIAESNLFFILETNGILMGYDATYAKALSKYKNLYVRISIKAGTPEGFQQRTGSLAEFYELPYKAVENAIINNLYFRVACMSDPRLMSEQERKKMIEKLRGIKYREELEEETCDPYNTTLIRLKAAEWDI